MFKKMICVVVMVCALNVGLASAFLYEIKMLSPTEIQALESDQLLKKYMEAKIEAKASGEFHYAAGFSSAVDYNRRKDLLRYLIHLRRELQARDLQPEPFDEWME